MMNSKKRKIIFSVGGGKGGVGKSIFSVALGTALAKDGYRTVLADLDLGAANLHTYLGIVSEKPTIADFILKKTASLEELLMETSVRGLNLISGAEFVPGMANPAHWMKLKIMRHVKSLPADYVILDLGAGVHFNTLDFFGVSDRGIVITAPEPGAVMNAYGFIKAALFRKLQNIFRRHSAIGPIIDAETQKKEAEKILTLDWLTEKIRRTASDMLPLMDEVRQSFNPVLVVNRIP
ncbi:MAG: P-loop NTPase, partial [Nitrospiraceae bacterium]